MKIERNILQRYASGQCTDEENKLVEAWFEDLDTGIQVSDEQLDVMVARLDKKVNPKSNYPNGMIWIGLAAAIICVVIGVGIYQNSSNIAIDPITNIAAIKAPTSAHAFLLLEDQSEYNLDELHVGDTLRANSLQLTRLASGELQYINATTQNKSEYHILRTKSGGNICLKLLDGSSIWVNANSEIQYPVSFATAREVKLKGEAYFEIAKSAEGAEPVPFYVRSDKQTIKVLGTKFVADFGERNLVALLEGKVALSNLGSKFGDRSHDIEAIVMKPGQIYQNSKLVTVTDIARYIDWKEGYFDVEGVTLGEFGQKLSDWYGIPIDVAPELRQKTLLGQISRQKDLSEVLDIVATALPIRYSLKDNKVIITAK